MTTVVQVHGPLTVTIAAEPDPQRIARWDELVLSHPMSDVTQLSGWARLRGRAGYRGVHVFVEDGGELVGGALVLVRRVPLLGTVGYVPYGPLVGAGSAEPEAVRTALADALRWLNRRHARSLFVQPPEGDEETSALLAARGFRPSTADIAPAASLRVDLSVPEDQLRRNLSRRLRGYLRKAEAAGVTVRPARVEELPVVTRLMQETGRHQHFTPFGTGYLEAMHRELAVAGGLICFLGEVGGRAVATSVTTGCAGTLKTRFGGFARFPEVRQLSVPAAVDWGALLWAKQQGYRWFDFSGVLPSSVPVLSAAGKIDVEALAGPDQFKARFGGQLVRYPQAVERIASPAFRTVYDTARRSDLGRPVVEWAKRRARSGRAGQAATD